MEITFAPNGVLQIDDAKLIYKNFRGEASKYNAAGKRNFSLLIPDRETADQLINDVNKFGVGWNVKIKEREDGEILIHLPINIKFNERGPAVYLISGSSKVRLKEDNVGLIDRIAIARVDLDIRPYDDMFNDKPFRSAYLQSIQVTQEIDRFAEDMADMEYPEE